LANSTAPYSLWQLTGYFLKLGATGFGGPVALVGYMQRDLVTERKWISLEDYKEGLTLAQLAPGPLAAQLAIYLGYVHYKITGATIAGIAFILPSFLMVLAIGIAYGYYGGLPWMQAVFYGVGASVIGIMAYHAARLVKNSIGGNWLLWVIFSATLMVTILTEQELVLLFLLAGITNWLVKTPPGFVKKIFNMKSLDFSILPAVTSLVSVGNISTIWTILLFFAKAGAFVFGSGLAIVPFLYNGVVKEYHWLTEQQFIDAVAVAMITPGPVVITVAFIGYLVEGFRGAFAAALATFLPCYLFTIIPAPYFKKYGKLESIKAFVNGVTAAAIGAIAGAVFILGRRSLIDIYTVIIALVSILILWGFKRIHEPYIILAAALFGYIRYFLLF
jgi:chromate transporter